MGEGDTLSFVTNRNQSGDYWCSADNGLNATVNASANLDVQCKLICSFGGLTCIFFYSGLILVCLLSTFDLISLTWSC